MKVHEFKNSRTLYKLIALINIPEPEPYSVCLGMSSLGQVIVHQMILSQ
jgi:hypothetical protein